ncbi:MAG TPA: CHASE3 domain-containing protein [Beijerinckiaceae bacterium]
MSLGPIALGLAFLLLVGSALALNLLLVSLTDSRSLVLRTTAILEDAAELQALVRTAETGQRGFVLTGERRYLAPYEQASLRVRDKLAELERTVRDPQQSVTLRLIRPLVEAKLDELAQTVALRQQEGFEAALTVVRTDVGQRLMEDIDAQLTALRDAEQRRLAERTADLERRASGATLAAALTGLLAVLCTALGVVWLSRQRARDQRLAAERSFRQDLERQVAQRTSELSQVNRELDAFAYTISHDLRAPLRAMHGYADALAEDYGDVLPVEGQRFTGRIAAAATRMENLIQDILTYSRLAREEVSLRPVSLETVVDQVLANAAPALKAAEAAVTVDRPLPGVRAHGPTLAQAIDNLVSNALKFVVPGTRPRIRIGVRRQGEGRVRLFVEDNGIGIDAEHRERVFRPFERLHGVETYPGTGIGLAIVRRSLERMGGTSGVESMPGQGSRFWIELTEAGVGAEMQPSEMSR